MIVFLFIDAIMLLLDLVQETVQDVDDQSDSDHELMVEGVLSSANNEAYELPSQAELIHQAFAGDNVEEEFERQKEEILNEENPEPEKPVLLPGWGQWTNVQKKKGLPSWMLEEHDRANKKRQEILKNRKDANLKHVIISEKLDKKVSGSAFVIISTSFTSHEPFDIVCSCASFFLAFQFDRLRNSIQRHCLFLIRRRRYLSRASVCLSAPTSTRHLQLELLIVPRSATHFALKLQIDPSLYSY